MPLVVVSQVLMNKTVVEVAHHFADHAFYSYSLAAMSDSGHLILGVFGLDPT
jgi:hypothetical protein